MLNGEGYDFCTDWWSIGCILFELVVGIPPFCGSTPQQVFNKIINFEDTLQQLENIPELQISEECWDLLKKLLCPVNKRLGRNGMKDILHHSFFKDINWKEASPPFVPTLSSETDLKYFKHELIPQEAQENECTPAFVSNKIVPPEIKGFTFQRDSFMKSGINKLQCNTTKISFIFITIFFFKKRYFGQ